MFEAVHGSAPDIAGKGVANPSGLLLAATQLLVHIGCVDVATTIKNAWLCTLESGTHTADVYRPQLSRTEVGTNGFTDAVIERLGERPNQLAPVEYRAGVIQVPIRARPSEEKILVGVDVFLDWVLHERDPDTLGRKLEDVIPSSWKLKMITNRGVKVYPEGLPETYRTDHWRCRFVAQDGGPRSFHQILDLLRAISDASLEVIKTEHLYTIAGKLAYSIGQGE